MTTISPHINRRGLGRTIVLLASVATLATVAATPAVGSATGSATAPALRVVTTQLSTRPHTWSYGWPIKPFDRQHPVRAFLNDPRIGDKGGKAFHFGIDISAPDGTAVYAVEAGTVYIDSPAVVAVAVDRSHGFGYWHIVPIVKSHQYVARHQLLGYIGKGWEHVHFAERRGGDFVNPLRDGGLGPYVDRTAPTVDSVSLVGSDLVGVAHDMPDPRVPGSWADEPVTPAILRVRIDTGGWKTAADFRRTMLPLSRFAQIYTPKTRQNHKGEAGTFSFYLARGLSRAAGHRVQVEASDTAGNRTVVSVLVGAEL